METSTGLCSLHTHCRRQPNENEASLSPTLRLCSSPWSNKYYDPEDPAAAIEDDSLAIPGDDLRKYEQAANEMFDLYRERCASKRLRVGRLTHDGRLCCARTGTTRGRRRRS